MRFLTLLISLAFSFNVFSNTIEEAKTLYSKRGLDAQGLENAKKAAEMYKSILSTSSGISDVEKAQLLVNQSEALYFVGLILQKNEDEKGALKVYLEGYEAGLAAVNMLGNHPGDKDQAINPKVAGTESILALSMYWELVNILRWGKLYGVFQALSKWKEIGKPRIEDILRLDATTMGYGVHRSAGKALLTIPGNQKIQGKGPIDFLQEAYEATENTVNGITLCNNMATVTFYLEALRDAKDQDKFCEIYSNLTKIMEDGSDETLGEMFPNLVPEARFEYGDFMSEKKNTRYAEQKCR